MRFYKLIKQKKGQHNGKYRLQIVQAVVCKQIDLPIKELEAPCVVRVKSGINRIAN